MCLFAKVSHVTIDVHSTICKHAAHREIEGELTMDWAQAAVVGGVIIVCLLFMWFIGKKYLK